MSSDLFRQTRVFTANSHPNEELRKLGTGFNCSSAGILEYKNAFTSPTLQEEHRMNKPIMLVVSLTLTLFCLPVMAQNHPNRYQPTHPTRADLSQGVNLKVNCGGKSAPSSINAALKLLNPAGPNTLIVSGSCNENVLIQGFNRLTLMGSPGVTISDASGGVAFVVDIEDSTDITLRGFTINGGSIGVQCGNVSVCRFDQNTIQGALTGVQVGQSRATFDTNTIQNNIQGLTSLESSSVRSNGGLVIQQNLSSGVVVASGGSFAAFGTTIQNNGGDGIETIEGASLTLGGNTITGNLFGVTILGHSDAWFAPENVITGNVIDGVVVRDVSFALFESSSTITGNGSGVDVSCQPQYPATRAALTNIGGGITNCVEP